MKTLPYAWLMLLPLVAFGASGLRPGDSAEKVRAELGLPRGQVWSGDRDLYYFDRGQVELRSGVVTRVALRSAEEQAALENKRSAEAARVREDQEIRRARLLAEGESLKAQKLSDPAFLASPVSYQLTFWEDFSRRYTEVPSAEQLNLARIRRAEQVAEARAQGQQAERLAELEARVAAAEARAANARDRGDYGSFYFPVSYSRRSRDYNWHGPDRNGPGYTHPSAAQDPAFPSFDSGFHLYGPNYPQPATGTSGGFHLYGPDYPPSGNSDDSRGFHPFSLGGRRL